MQIAADSGGHVGVARIGCDLHRQAGRVYRSVLLVQRAREQALGEVFAEGPGGLRVTGRGQEFPHLGELLVDDSRRSLLQASDLQEGLRLLLGEQTLVVRVDEYLGAGGDLVLADQAVVLTPVDDVPLEIGRATGRERGFPYGV